MKVVILAGGLGTRLGEATIKTPKPLVTIGPLPILLHIMNYYAQWGHTDFIICAGYRSIEVKRFVRDLELYTSPTYSAGVLPTTTLNTSLNWKIHVVDTGITAQTGARIARISDYIDPGENFFMTYGDGLANVNLRDSLMLHEREGRIATVTAVAPPPRFGGLQIDGNRVLSFSEKKNTGRDWINGGYFVLNQRVFEYLSADNDCVFEKGPLEKLATDGQLTAFIHKGFWSPMDTPRDRSELEKLWNSNAAPWTFN